MDRMDAPTLDEALEGQQRLIAEKLQSTIENENLAYYKRIAEEMLEENDSVTVVAAALKMMTKSQIQLNRFNIRTTSCFKRWRF